MGCASCANNDGSGVPAGCKSNGNCATGGCEKLDVFDWLSDMRLPSGQKRYNWAEVRFKSSRKSFFKNLDNLELMVGDIVSVEASSGYDIGVVSIVGELARIQMKRKSINFDSSEVQKLHHKATQGEIDKWQKGRKLEHETMLEARRLSHEMKLVMKISDVEYQGDHSKATFYYTAEDRVDFRDLIKKLAEKFKVRIEMRQIGARQEASRLGGIGSCGRELCCSTWLTDFRSVSTSAARYQQLSLNPQKLAGQCGKLKCCLNYELDSYLDAIKQLPRQDTKLRTKKGHANHMKTDIFKGIMWYIYSEPGAVPIPLEATRVKEIVEMNAQGEEPEDLRQFVQTVAKPREVDYLKVDAQDDLTRFDDKMKKKRKRKKGPQGEGRGQNQKGEGGNQKRSGGGNKPRKSGNKPRAAGGNKPRPGGNKPRGKGGNRPNAGGENKQGGGNRPTPSNPDTK